jgi:hypothetical protein
VMPPVQACKARLPLSEETDNHYKSVCRSLVNRAKKKSLKLRKDIHLAEVQYCRIRVFYR